MWGEQVDSVNIDSRVWPRASAVSERLWSPMNVINQKDATDRLEQFRCHIARRGIGAGPINPGFYFFISFYLNFNNCKYKLLSTSW